MGGPQFKLRTLFDFRGKCKCTKWRGPRVATEAWGCACTRSAESQWERETDIYSRVPALREVIICFLQSACAQGTRRRRLHLWGVCDPGCAATREKTQSCPAEPEACQSPPSVSPPGRQRSSNIFGVLGVDVDRVRGDCCSPPQRPMASQSAAVKAANDLLQAHVPQLRVEQNRKRGVCERPGVAVSARLKDPASACWERAQTGTG